jgi:hypothetical protein
MKKLWSFAREISCCAARQLNMHPVANSFRQIVQRLNVAELWYGRVSQ